MGPCYEILFCTLYTSNSQNYITDYYFHCRHRRSEEKSLKLKTSLCIIDLFEAGMLHIPNQTSFFALPPRELLEDI